MPFLLIYSLAMRLLLDEASMMKSDDNLVVIVA
jgi:hypothetical protein